jgi:hypothetical protein
MRFQLAAIMVLLTVLAASGNAKMDPAKTLLTTAFHLSPAEIERLDGGGVISRTLDVKNRREIATLGIVRIKTLPLTYVERLADITTFKRTDDVLQVGRFSNPPQPKDIASLTIDEAELKRIRDCRLEDCEVRLGADGIERLRRDIDWRAPDAGPQASRLVLQLLVDYVGRYGQRGTAATMEYADSGQRLNVGREFASLLDADTLTSVYAPRLRQHMLDYPTSGEKITDFIYWSKELVRSRPVISITHVSTATIDDSPIAYAIASKQIYAMHYYDASLGLTLLLPDRAASSPATYVVYLNRSRIDLFDGAFGGVTRRIVAGRARTVVANQLQRLQQTLAPPPPQEAATHVR